MSESRSLLDACVVGGGPAGAVAAMQLSRLGHRVGLVDAGPSSRPPIQHLSTSIDPITRSLGLTDTFERAAFARVEARVVAWGESPRFVPDGAAGCLVDRRVLDELLQERAVDAGAVVLGSTRALRFERTSAGWEIAVVTPAGRETLRAALLIDASGGRSSMAARTERTSARTVAMWGWWLAPMAGVTRVEAVDSGWLWGAPTPDRRTIVVAFVEHFEVAGSTRRQRADRYRAIVAGSALFADLGRGPDDDGISVVDASAYVHPHPAERNVFRVGAAAIAVDPLSGQGVQIALRSAVHGAAAAHTTLIDPCRATDAAEFHQASTRRTFDHHRRWAAGEYALAAQSMPTPFWTARAVDPEAAASTASAAPHDSPARPPLDASARLRWNVDVAWRPTPVLVGSEVEVCVALHHPTLDQPLAFVGDRAVAELRDEFPACLRAVADGRGPAAARVAHHLFQLGVLELASV